MSSQFFGSRSIKTVLDSIFKFKMGELFLHYSGIDPLKRSDALSILEHASLIDAVTNLQVEAGDARSFEEATVSTGGVSVDEVDQRTLESKIIRGLYMSGEMLDVDGDCGGFNLQFAWATGTIAARSVCEA